MAKRRYFSDTFKGKVALEALRGDKTIQEIVAKYQVHPNQVSSLPRWCPASGPTRQSRLNG
ncbi:protein of unknown function [Nitratireductor aquimarinus]